MIKSSIYSLWLITPKFSCIGSICSLRVIHCYVQNSWIMIGLGIKYGLHDVDSQFDNHSFLESSVLHFWNSQCNFWTRMQSNSTRWNYCAVSVLFVSRVDESGTKIWRNHHQQIPWSTWMALKVAHCKEICKTQTNYQETRNEHMPFQPY